MKSETEIVPAEAPLVARGDSGGLLAVIDRIVAAGITPESVAAVGKLLDMQERVIADQRRQVFADALTKLQARVPQIDKNGAITDNAGKVRNRYSKYEDIDLVLRPMLREEGFAVTFNEEDVAASGRRYSCTLLHREGHSETKFMTLPLDNSGSKNGIQSAGSSFSYARRYLLKAHLNLVEKGEDTDGNDMEPITEDQARDLETMIADFAASITAAPNDDDRAKIRARLLRHMGAEKVADIRSRDLAKAQNALRVAKK